MSGIRRAASRITVGAALTAGLALSGCVAQEPGDSDGSGSDGELNVAGTTATTTLDPASGCTLEDSQLSYQLYVQPLKYGETVDENGVREVDPTTVEPYFAQDWDVSEDGLTYTFQLQSDWVFPSGEPVDAEALKYSFERSIAIGGCGSAIINDLYLEPTLIEEINVIDAETVEINLSKADPDFLLAMATAAASIVDPSLVEANGGVVDGTPNEWMDSHDAGSGPFRLDSYEPGTSAVLVRDEEFEGDPAASERINVSWVDSDSALTLQMQNDQVDVAIGLSKNSASSFEDAEGFEVAASTATANMQMLMPADAEPWSDPLVREAVTYAIPYEDILQNTLKGYGELYYGPIPPTMPGFDESQSAPREYDLERAQELMEQAGIDAPVPVTLDILSGDATMESLATTIQGSLSEIGIDISVNSLSESAWGDAVYNGQTQAALRLDGPAVFSAGYYLQYDESCSSPHNTGRICVDGNEELLEQARAAGDDAERDTYLSELTSNWIAESPKAILYLDSTAVVLREGTQYVWNPSTDMRDWAPAG